MYKIILFIPTAICKHPDNTTSLINIHLTTLTPYIWHVGCHHRLQHHHTSCLIQKVWKDAYISKQVYVTSNTSHHNNHAAIHEENHPHFIKHKYRPKNNHVQNTKTADDIYVIPYWIYNGHHKKRFQKGSKEHII